MGALGGQGNPVFGSNDQTNGTPLEWLLPIVFIVLLLPALPLFALREEQMFRQGAENWSWARRVVMALAFGLMHAIVGIPIGFALALSIGGAYFQLVYLRRFRQSVSQRRRCSSTRAHTTYNGVIVIVALVVCCFAGHRLRTAHSKSNASRAAAAMRRRGCMYRLTERARRRRRGAARHG